jgi:hypothetical protein
METLELETGIGIVPEYVMLPTSRVSTQSTLLSWRRQISWILNFCFSKF